MPNAWFTPSIACSKIKGQFFMMTPPPRGFSGNVEDYCFGRVVGNGLCRVREEAQLRLFIVVEKKRGTRNMSNRVPLPTTKGGSPLNARFHSRSGPKPEPFSQARSLSIKPLRESHLYLTVLLDWPYTTLVSI